MPNRLLATLSLQRGDWLDSLEQRLAIAEAGGNGEIAALFRGGGGRRSATEPINPAIARFIASLAPSKMNSTAMFYLAPH